MRRLTPSAPALELTPRYIGGDASLDLVNTADWTSRGREQERLTGYAELTRWAEGAGVLSRADGERLRRLARSRPRAAAAICGDAKRLREVLRRIYRSVALGEPADAAWRAFNAALAGAMRRMRLEPRPDRRRAEGPGADRAWHGAEKDLGSLLWPVVWSAAALLTSEEARQIRVCDGPDCGWMYVDRSRNGLRRWCEMATCGTAAKTRRRREKGARATTG